MQQYTPNDKGEHDHLNIVLCGANAGAAEPIIDVNINSFHVFTFCSCCPQIPTAKEGVTVKLIAHNWQWHVEGCPSLPAETIQQEKS